MFSWERIVGVVLLLYALYVISKGRMVNTDEGANTPDWLDRKKQPVRFWISVALMVGVAVLMISGVLDF